MLGLGVRGIGWRDIEIERLPTGQPAVRLHGRAAAPRRAARHGPDRGVDQPRVRTTRWRSRSASGPTGGRYLFPPDIEERLDDRERRILARIERLRELAEAGGAGALASEPRRPVVGRRRD